VSAAGVSEFAPAKVNLWLRVTGRHDDGYHLLDSLVVFADAGDVVRAAPAETLSLALDGPFAAGVPVGEENLVLRAAAMLRDAAARHPHPVPLPEGDGTLAGVVACPLPQGEGQGEGAFTPPGAALALTKTLPPASGIGGGSSDAAATLRALTRLWALDPAIAGRVAPTLGADVPVCLRATACRMRGIGDVLDPVPPLPDCGLVLANPKIPLETRSVFAARRGAFSAPFPPGTWTDAASLAADIRAAGNDLRQAAISLCPAIADVLAALAALPGALCAQMSGSGATCLALFASAAAARQAAAALPEAWWRWGGGLARA
jgi:4-diphosphocytidyl-2-C-methyl-D-erythritol kinase